MKNYITKFLAVAALALSLSAPALAQTGPTAYRVNTINALLQINLYGTSGVAWVGGGATLGDGLGGVFYYDSTSSATTNVYMIYKPVNDSGRWFKHPTAVANQSAAVTVGVDTTYAWKLLRAGQTNFFGIGADNNIAYIQTFNGKNLHINNLGNSTILNATTGNVGIRDSDPGRPLVVSGTASTGIGLAIRTQLTGGGSGSDRMELGFGYNDAPGVVNQPGVIGFVETSAAGQTQGDIYIATRNVTTDTAVTERLRVTGIGNIGVGTATFGTSAARVLGLFNGTAPSTSPADTVQLWSDDVSAGNAALFIRGEDGSIASIGDGGLAFTGAQAVSTTTGNLSLTTGGGNGNIALTFNGTGGLTVGGGAAIISMLSATATLDFPSIAANTSADLTITVTGAAANDIAMAGPPVTQVSGITVSAFVSAANTVTIRAANVTVGAIDPASATYRASVIRY